MRIKVSTDGQVVLPSSMRRRLGLRAGDSRDIELDGERIVLTPGRKPHGRGRIAKDRITGLPVLTAGKDAPTLTSEQVRRFT